MTTPAYSILHHALVNGVSGAVARGSVVLPSSAAPAYYVVGTTANRGTRRAEAIALTAFGGTGVGTVELQQSGTIDASISGLAVGAASWVRCSATGTIERCTPVDGDDLIGYAEEDGRVHLLFGVLTADIVNGGGGSVPSGTGLRKVVSGVEDAAASTLVNADVSASAAIAVTKLETGSANGQVLMRTAGANGFATIADVNVNAAANIAGTKISPNFGAQEISTANNAVFHRWLPSDTYGTDGAVQWPYKGAGGLDKILQYEDSVGTDRNVLTVGDGDAYGIGAVQLVGTFLSYQFSFTAQTAASTFSHRKLSFFDGSVGSTQFVLEDGRNISMFAAGSYGSGDGVLFIGNSTANPSANPTGGGILYVEAGALKWRGSSGTVTTIANA